jgi:hypothetical protein
VIFSADGKKVTACGTNTMTVVKIGMRIVTFFKRIRKARKKHRIRYKKCNSYYDKIKTHEKSIFLY